MQRLRRATATVLVFLMVTGLAQARTLDQVPAYLKKEGGFVTYPAIAASALGLTAGAILSLPAALLAAPVGWAAGDPLGYALLPVSVLATGGAEAGYHVGGALPWALKNGFYDAPMAGIARVKGERPSGMVADIEPPPPDLSLTQYLESTPPEARLPVADDRRVSAALPPPKEATSLMLLKRKVSPFKPPPGVGGAPTRAARVSPSAPGTAPAPVAMPPSPAAGVAPLPAPPVTVAAPTTAPVSPGPARAAPLVPASSPVSSDAAEAVEVERPSLKGEKKKKRKFSERFGF